MTVDHVSGGRAGLNIVCGWNQEEFDMFGHHQSEHDDRYEQGFEWYAILTRIFTSEVPFDHRGRFYDLKQVIGAPAPVQQPRPVTLSAAFSPAGRRFAAATSDFLFTTIPSFESAKSHIAEIRRFAAEAGRDVGVLTTTHVVCRETDAEAMDYYRFYAEENADAEAVTFHQHKKEAHYGAVEPDTFKIERRRYAGGTGSYPLVGRPERIADEIIAMHKLGLAGATISFVNFNEELPFFIERVLPLLQQAGLRDAAAMRRTRCSRKQETLHEDRVAGHGAVRGAAAARAAGFAETYPSRFIRMVVPYPAGGTSDVLARVLAKKMGDSMGQQIVIENIGGAAGTIGAASVARAEPDGYTLIFGYATQFTIAPALYQSLSLRSDPLVHPDRQRCSLPLPDVGLCGRTGELARRCGRLRQSQSRQADLCVTRRRHVDPPGG